MKVKQKDVVLIKFPFTDLSFNKIRPALVVSNNDFNLISNDFLLIPLTSILKDVKYSLLLEESDLIVKSRLRVDKITYLDKELIFKKIDVVSDCYFDKVKSELFKCF